jgi:hypothetical protein
MAGKGAIGMAGWAADLSYLLQLAVIAPLLFTVKLLGYALAGQLAGFHLVHLSLGPLQFGRQTAGSRLRLAPPWFSLAINSVPVGDRYLRLRLAIKALGGPLACLLTGLGLFNLIASLEPATAWLMSAGFASLLFGLLSLIPYRGSDGAFLLALLYHSPRTSAQLASDAIVGAVAAGHRPRHWQTPRLNEATRLSDGSPTDAIASLAAYTFALDSGNLQQAGQWLDYALSIRSAMPVHERQRTLLEAAYYEALHRHDARQARRWFDEAGPGWRGQPTFLRAEAAVLLAEGRASEARQRITAGLAATRLMTLPGYVPFEQELLHGLRHQSPSPTNW